MKTLHVIFLIAACCLLSSCGPDYIYEQEIEISDGNWFYEDTLNFEVEITDTLEIYNLYLDINHSTDYATQNIYILIYTKFPSGERIKERVNIDFADKTGQWYGECNSSGCNLRVNIQQGAFFNALGKHLFTIEQFMRTNPLPGINSAAFRIENTGQKRTPEIK